MAEFHDLTIDEMARELARLRNANDTLKHATDPEIKRRREFEKMIEDLQRRFHEEMEGIRKQKSLVQQNIDNINNQINGNENDIRKLQELMAKKAAEQSELDRMSELEKELSTIMDEFDAWNKARLFQKEDVLFTFDAYKRGANGILNANDMGLGKTMETAVTLYLLHHNFIKEHGRIPRIAWFTKKSLIVSSTREIRKWWPDAKMMPLLGSAKPEMREWALNLILEHNAVMITNYETARTTPGVMAVTWDIVVIDEVHKLKGGANASGPTAVWEIFKRLCRNTRFVIMLSGTPMVNKPQEVWSYLHIFQPEKFPSFKQFDKMFTTWPAGMEKPIIDVDALLKGALKGQVIRRRKDEVGIQIPDLTREFRIIEMTDKQREIYDNLDKYFWLWLDEQEGKALTATNILAKLTRLRQLSLWPPSIKAEVSVADKEDPEIVKQLKMAVNIESSAKIDETMDIIETLNDSGEQCVVFATFNEPLHEIKRRCSALDITCETMTGENSYRMGEFEKDFQEGKTKVLAINLSVGEGMNLHKTKDWVGGASYVVLMDLWWSPARNEQAEARVHRFGQTDPVNSIILQNENSVDGFIAAIVEDKAKLFSSIMESSQLRPASEWRALLKKTMKGEE